MLPMPHLDTPAGSASSDGDLFDSDPAFLQALEAFEIPGENVEIIRPLKRAHSPENEGNYMNAGSTYGAAKFGGIREFMTHKRAKLQVQNSALDDAPASDKNQIFRGLAIYVRQSP